uniref:Putative glycosyltransferase n=1 Tax=viral metagenome TaxID=1070528 RepID=A0A6M3J163_9ZZZZ
MNILAPSRIDLRRVSALVPLYNCAPFIEECLDSMLRQTHKDTEIVIYDDASTDDSVGRVKAVMEKNPGARIVLLEGKENKGPGYARNRCWEAATGGFVALQDADDVSSYARFECELAAIFKYGLPVVTCKRRPMAALGVKVTLMFRPKAIRVHRGRGSCGGMMCPRTPMVPFQETWGCEDASWKRDLGYLYFDKKIVRGVFYFSRDDPARETLRTERKRSQRYFAAFEEYRQRRKNPKARMDAIRPAAQPILQLLKTHSKPPE